MSVARLRSRSQVTVAEAIASLVDPPRLGGRTATHRFSLERFTRDVGADTPIATIGID